MKRIFNQEVSVVWETQRNFCSLFQICYPTFNKAVDKTILLPNSHQKEQIPYIFHHFSYSNYIRLKKFELSQLLSMPDTNVLRHSVLYRACNLYNKISNDNPDASFDIFHQGRLSFQKTLKNMNHSLLTSHADQC